MTTVLDAPRPWISLRNDLLGQDRPGLARALAAGKAVDPLALAGVSYRGVSLGLPDWIDRLAWKTFVKAFQLDGRGGVSGYNVRLEQTGIDGELVAQRRSGKTRIFGHFQVRGARDGEVPQATGPAVVFDYAPSPTRDAVVSVDGTANLLLGVMYVALPGKRFRTPSYFTLERHGFVMW